MLTCVVESIHCCDCLVYQDCRQLVWGDSDMLSEYFRIYHRLLRQERYEFYMPHMIIEMASPQRNSQILFPLPPELSSFALLNRPDV